MATPAMQRYAAEIFRLQQDAPYVGLNELSESANSSMQATARSSQSRQAAARLADSTEIAEQSSRSIWNTNCIAASV